MPSDESLRKPLSSALRFAASRSAITAEQERAILAAFDAATVIDKALAQQREEIARLREMMRVLIPMVDLGREEAQAAAMEITSTPRADAVKLAQVLIRSGEYRKEPDHG